MFLMPIPSLSLLNPLNVVAVVVYNHEFVHFQFEFPCCLIILCYITHCLPSSRISASMFNLTILVNSIHIRSVSSSIPLLSDYSGIESEVNGKGFLQKVKESHNIDVTTSRALMVSLKRKKYITIGGGRKTFIALLERGIRHLQNVA